MILAVTRLPHLVWYDRGATGGHTLFDRESRPDGEEPHDKQPELFDLHVMMFADGSSATVAGLQQVFDIERAVAEKLLRDVPVVVKRAADPSVAAALIDALQKLGAQVVLLPSSGARLDEGRQHAGPRPPDAPGPRWGGLDLEPPGAARASAELELDIGTARAGTTEIDQELARDALRDAERPPHTPRASVVPLRDWSTDGDTVMASRAEDFVSGGEAELLDGAEVPSIPPLFDEPRRSDLDAEAAAESDRPPRAVASSHPPADARALRRSPTPVHVDLGLGTVPPLPVVASDDPVARRPPPAPPPPPSVPRAGQQRVVAPPPPAAPRPRRVAAVPERGRVAQRSADVPDIAELPEIDAAARRPPRNPGLTAPRLAGGDAYWTARRSDAPPQAAAAVRELPAASPAERDEHDTSDAAEPSARPAPAQLASSARPGAGYPRGLALAELSAGLLVLYLGVRFDNSVLYGNATLPSLVLHGLALYGIGGGIAGLWP